MLEILVYSYLSSIHIYICGYLFFLIFINNKISNNYNIFELGIFGAFALSFIGLFFNFFTSLDKIFNTIIFLLPIILFLFFFNKRFIKLFLLFSIPVSILLTLTMSYDGTYRPDAGLYHLPFISILNENKIIIGINNIHFRFGHISIMQYLSAIYNNFIFGDKGITIPVGIIFCNFLGYCLIELIRKKNSNMLKIFIFIIIIFILFRVNRYSDFGNDAPANLLFFYIIIESLKGNNGLLKIKKTIIASTFIFLNKITLLLAFFIPFFYIIKNFKIEYLINKLSIFSFIFILFFLGKNLLISGCLVFPLEQTCFKNLYWYDANSNRGSNAYNARVENEAWTKGWVNQVENKKNYTEYLNNYTWIKTWLSSEGKTITKKLLPFSIFIFALIIILKTYEIRVNKYIKNKDRESNETNTHKNFYLCFFISFIGCIIWFLKFPVFRYGYGYLISTTGLLISFYCVNFKFFSNRKKFVEVMKYLIFFVIFLVTIKNFVRIYEGIDKNKSVWPNIYNSGNSFKKKDNLEILKNNEVFFYKSKKGECYYSKSPCTHYYNGTDFTLDEISINNFKGYKIYFFIK